MDEPAGPQDQSDPGPNGLERRSIPHVHPGAVAFGLPEHEWRSCGRRPAACMVAKRISDIDESPAALPATPGNVGILVIHEQSRVQSA